MPLPLVKFLATPLPALVVGEKIWFLVLGPPHFKNASAIAAGNITISIITAHTERVYYVPPPTSGLFQSGPQPGKAPWASPP